ncbi:MAG: sugar nucleotide-binding protein [Pirellulaceae bacterium]
MKLLIVGCGYVGGHVARQYYEQFAACEPRVYALTRSTERVAELQSAQIQPLIYDWLADSQAQLPEVDAVLVAVPHREVPPLGSQTHVRGLQNLLANLPNCTKRLVYLSTTGVYGTCNNEQVDESTPVSPTRIGPQIAVAAESWLNENTPAHLESTVVRLAGIYGPGRLPLADKLRAGEALNVPRQGHLNLVHVQDIASVLCQIFSRSMQHQMYLFSDGQPVGREEFYRELARQCGVEDVQFENPAGPAHTLSRRATNKRIDPARLISELKYQFLFPDYRQGIQHALADVSSSSAEP